MKFNGIQQVRRPICGERLSILAEVILGVVVRCGSCGMSIGFRISRRSSSVGTDRGNSRWIARCSHFRIHQKTAQIVTTKCRFLRFRDVISCKTQNFVSVTQPNYE